ncbi:MAG: Ca-activated chloride channel homolog [Methyloprofundus sp.]|nr:MAG: Ca-activated chloride channel homolog [Methyloprofundus sp.]
MNMSEFHFIRPYWLLATLPLLVLVFFNIKNKLQQGGWSAVCDADLLPFILQEKDAKPSRVPLVTSSLAAILTIIALAGPTWQRLPMPAFRNAAALVIALDLSRSMDAADIKPSRIERARYKIADLLNKRKDGQTALLVYANSAFTVTPLTEDVATIKSQLSALTSDIMPAQGSNSALAINKAIELFKNAGLTKGQILLVSDDDMLADIEVPNGYQLSILGVGTQEGAPVKMPNGGFLKDASGNIVVPKLDVRAMRQAAQAGGGIYQQITDTDADVEKLSRYFEQIAKRSETIDNDLLLENWQEAGIWLLLPILFLAAFSFRRGLLAVFILLALPLPKNSYAYEWQDLWQSDDQQAYQHYLNDDYQGAAEKFTDPAWQAAAQYKAGMQVAEEDMLPATTDTGFYNQANVLAKAGKLQEAIAAYDEALALNPNNEDAQYNKELVEKALEQQKQQQQDQDKQQDDQEKQESPEDSQEQGEQSDQQGEQQEPQDSDSSEESESQKSDAEEQEESEPEAEAQENTEQEQQEAEQPEPEAAQESLANEQDEQQQANEQWLKRIPDDPAGLLKRKFLYQYGRQQQPRNSRQQW